jgi:hypothetical protein
MLSSVDLPTEFLKLQDSRSFVYDTLDQGLQMYLKGDATEKEYKDLIMAVTEKFKDISSAVNGY